jgi:hypothetical protein
MRVSMRVSMIAVLVLLAITPFRVSSVAEGPSCSSDQRLDSQGRHRELIVRARNINNRMMQQRQLSDHFPTAQELGLTNANGFETTVQSDATAYMFFIRDTTDPCRSAVFSDENGLIYDAKATQ